MEWRLRKTYGVEMIPELSITPWDVIPKREVQPSSAEPPCRLEHLSPG